jgi:RNA-directed DNA polymerase
MQAKLHRWAAADPGRRFDDLFNFVHDPATLAVAFERVATNRGARTAGSDGLTVARIETEIGVSRFLDELRGLLKTGQFRPEPVRDARSRNRVGRARSAAWGSRRWPTGSSRRR